MADTDPALDIQSPDSPPESSVEPANQTISLSEDQLKAAGIDGLKSGDTFSITIHGTVTDTADGITATIDDATDGSKADAEEPEGDDETGDDTKLRKSMKPSSPMEMGFGGSEPSV